MKIYTRDTMGNWNVPLSDDSEGSLKCYNLLPDAPEDRFRMIVEYYSILHRYYRLVARRGEHEGLIVEELSENDARSLAVAYLNGGDVFHAARGGESGITDLIRQYPVHDVGLLALVGGKVPLQNTENFTSELANKVSNYRMLGDKGLRIVLSDSLELSENETPDLHLMRASIEVSPQIVIAGVIGALVVAGLLFLCLRGCNDGETSQKKTDDKTPPITCKEDCKCKEEQVPCTCPTEEKAEGNGKKKDCKCKKGSEQCTCPTESSADTLQQQT